MPGKGPKLTAGRIQADNSATSFFKGATIEGKDWRQTEAERFAPDMKECWAIRSYP